MYHTGEVKALHLNQVEDELRRRIDELDRRLRETKSALDALEWRARARESELGDGWMMAIAWSPVAILILIALAAR